MLKRQTIEFKLHTEIELPQDMIDSVPSQGQADSAVADILDMYHIEVSLKDSIAFLKGYGAWDDSELQDLERNKERIVWLACLDCKENDTQYFYMGE